MAITRVKEHWTKSGSHDNTSGREYTRVFKVTSDDPLEYVNAVLVANDGSTAIPTMLAAHPGDSSCFMTKKEAALLDTEESLSWLVTCKYKYVPGVEEGGGSTPPEWPWDFPPQVEIRSAKGEEAADFAWGRRQGIGPFAVGEFDNPSDPARPLWPIRNSAGDPFDPAVMRDTDHVVVQITRAEQDDDVDLGAVSKFRESVNSEAVNVVGFALLPLEGRLLAYDVTRAWTTENDPVTEAPIAYYEVVYQIEIDRSLHTAKLVDAGFRERGDGVGAPSSDQKFPTADRLVWILDKDGKRPSEPSLLDGTGAALSGDEVEPIVIQYLTQPALDWRGAAGLDLPESMPG